MKNIYLKFIFLVPFLFSAGCASIHSQLKFDSFGEYNKSSENEIQTQFKKVQNDPAEILRPELMDRVSLYQDTLPEGIRMDGGVLSVEKGYAHQIMGKFSLAPDSYGTMSIFKFADYKDSWRKTLCYPQVVLTYATLMIWPILPVAYPCFSHFGSKKEEYATEMKKIGLVTGGDLIVFSFVLSNSDNDIALAAVGYVIKLDPALKGKKLKTQRNDFNKI